MKPLTIILTLILSCSFATLTAQESNSNDSSPEENVLVLTRITNGKTWVFKRGAKIELFYSNGKIVRVNGFITSIDMDEITVNRKTIIPLAHIKKIKPKDSFLLATMKPVSGVATLLVLGATIAAATSEDEFFEGAEKEVVGMGLGLALVTSVPLWFKFNKPRPIGEKYRAEILPISSLNTY